MSVSSIAKSAIKETAGDVSKRRQMNVLIDEELQAAMRARKDINWSKAIREFIREILAATSS